MTTTQDASFGIALEDTYGTAVVVSRFPEFVSETLDWKKNVKQSESLRVGRRLPLKRGRVIPTVDASGDLVIEAASKGQGLLWKWLLGAGSSALVSGSTYQQVFTLADTLPSATVQKVLPDVNGSLLPFTFMGVVADSLSIDFGNADLLKVTGSLNARDVATDVAAAAPSYIAGDVTLFNFAGASIYSGAFTEPGATTLASAVTELGNVKSGSISVKHNLQADRYTLGGEGRKRKPLVATREITAKIDVEFDTAVLAQAVLDDTPMSLVVTFEGANLSTGVETLQIAIPCLVPESELPKSNGDKIIVQSLQLTALADLTSTQPIWVVLRTSDTAL